MTGQCASLRATRALIGERYSSRPVHTAARTDVREPDPDGARGSRRQRRAGREFVFARRRGGVGQPEIVEINRRAAFVVKLDAVRERGVMIECGHIFCEHFVDADGGPVGVYNPRFGERAVGGILPEAVGADGDDGHGVGAAVRHD